MKLTLALPLFSCGAFSAFAFTGSPLAFSPARSAVKGCGAGEQQQQHAQQQRQSLMSLNMGSRAAEKKASRQAWADARSSAKEEEKEAATTAVAGLQTNENGLEYVKLVHPDTGATSDVYLYGGVVTSYVVDGVDYIAVRPDAKTDGSKPISGGLSHCWPQFGPGEIQQHGFARNVNWTVKSMTDTSVELEMAPSDYTKEMWDKEFLCTFAVDLGGGEEDSQSSSPQMLSTTMTVDNKGEEPYDFQAALHSYFSVSSLDNLEIRGSFQNREFLNKLAGEGEDGEMQTEEREAITIAEEYDRVYKGVNDPVLNDKGTGMGLAVLNTEGWEDTVLWSPYGNEGMGYNNFVCVESVKFDPVTLGGGESWSGKMSLKPTPLE